MKLSIFLVGLLTLASSAMAGTVTLSLDRGRDEAHLPSCEGTVEMTKSDQGNRGGEQVNLVFRDVRFCSNFDIVSNAGESLSYDGKKIPEQRGGLRGGSFTLPKRVLERGWNNVKIVIRSNSAEHQDVLKVQFVVVPVPQPAPRPDPVYVPRTRDYDSNQEPVVVPSGNW